jgi:transmembrane sensor
MTEKRIVDQAIEWMLLLESPDTPRSDRAAFEQWRSADPRHATAYARLTDSVRQFEVPRQVGAKAEVLRRSLQQRGDRRKALQRIAALAGLTVGAGALFNQVTPIAEITADLRTGTAERQTHTLDDGSVLVLNARSAADLWVDQTRRLIKLRAGELQIRVARNALLPFAVETIHGTANAAQDTMVVRTTAEYTEVAAVQAQVTLASLSGATARLAPSQHARFDSRAIAAVAANTGGESSWVDGYYTAYDTPLARIVDALRSYRRGILRLEPTIAQLRVSGAFPLDDTDRALNALAATLHVRVVRYTPYWVSILAAA